MRNHCKRCIFEEDAVLRPNDAPCKNCKYHPSKQKAHNIVKTTSQIKAGLEGMMDRLCYITGYLENSTAETEDECISRLRVLEEKKNIELALRALGFSDLDLKAKYYNITIL